MSPHLSRRTCVVAAVLALGVLPLGAGSAAADRPTIDPSLLPAPAPAVPPDPTEQRNACVPTVPAQDGPSMPDSLRSLDFSSVWPITQGAGQVVAVIDTGVSPHPRLPGLQPGGDYVYSGDGLSDCDSHGTLVAGLIAATRQPGSGFAGGAPEARIISIRQSSNAFQKVTDPQDDEGASVANAGGYGNVLTMAAAVRTAADLGATVINISEVACVPAGSGVADGPLGAAVEYAALVKDVVIVAAAGNTDASGQGQCRAQNPPPDPANPTADQWDRISTIATPAWFDDYVLTVGSVGPDGSAAPFTLAGPWVDVAAPGVSMTSLSPTDGGLVDGLVDSQGTVSPIQGTSFSAPLVSAVAALVRAHRPDLSAMEVMERIEATAHSPAEGWNPAVGHGVVDPLAAVTGRVSVSPRAIPAEAVAVAAPVPPIPPDHRPRNTALVGTGIVLAVLLLAVGASIPLRSNSLRSRSR